VTRSPGPMVHYYVAASLDGFIATPDGGVAWLDPFNASDYGFDAFLGRIDTVVMGRTTYQQALTFPGPWPYAGKRVIVLSSNPHVQMQHGAQRRHGDVGPLAAQLRQASQGDIWVVGGGVTARAFLEAGALDRVDLYLIPVALGKGIPLFGSAPTPALSLRSSRAYENSVLELIYDVPHIRVRA